MQQRSAQWKVWLLTDGVAGVGALLFVGMVVPAALSVQRYLAQQQEAVIAAVDVGRAVKTTWEGDAWTGWVMKVETEKGFFELHGSMEVFKDEPFVHESRGSGESLLCQGNPKRCLKVARTGLR